MLKRIFGSGLLFSCLVFGVSSLAWGETITGINYIGGVTIPGGSGVGFSSSWGNEAAWYPIYTLNGSGLNVSTGAHANTVSGNGWLSGGGPPQWIIFDLGQSYSLQAVRMWNYSRTTEPAWRQIKDVNVYVSATNHPVGDSGWGTAHPLTFAHITPSETVDISETKVLQATGRYVLFYITSCWPEGGQEIPGMSEIRFTAEAPSTKNLTVAADPANADSLEPAPGVHSYVTNSYASLNAWEFADCPQVYGFDHWVGAGVESPQSATTRVLMNQDRTVTAVFALQSGTPCYELTIQTDPPGVANVTPAPGTYVSSGQSTTVSLAADLYVTCPEILVFSRWEGDVLDSTAAQTSVIVNQNKTVTAVFTSGLNFGSACQPPLPGDLNQDCLVNLMDLALLAADWLKDTSAN